MLKKFFLFAFILLLSLSSALAESAPTPAVTSEAFPIEIIDSTGRCVVFEKAPERIVALSASLAEAWLLAGGSLCGVTDDAFERGLDIDPELPIIGTIKAPSAEAIVSLEPDLILLTDDTVSHVELVTLLADMNLPYLATSLDSLEDYHLAMEGFTRLTGRSDLYAQNVTAILDEITALMELLPDDASASPSVLFLRAFSSGVKVKAHDHIVCDILDEIGVGNIAADHPHLEDIGLEAIAAEDPDYIFAVAMGDEDKALAYLNGMIAENPVWQALSAVKEDRLILLDQALYHYKPNHRWAESYSTLLEILYPDIYAEIHMEEAENENAEQ